MALESARGRGVAAEVRGREIELGERDALELVEADARQLLREHRRVADQHDRQPVGVQVLPRHALDVVRRDRVDALAVGLQLVQIEAVEHRVQHLQRDRARRLDRQRKAAGQVFLRVRELALADTLALQPPELVDDQPQRLAGRLRSRVGLRDDVAGVLERVESADAP